MPEEQKNLKPAVLWETGQGGKVQCNLCCWNCVIAKNKLGKCCVRKNIDGKLYSLNYHKVCAANVDPIEKKPLFHFQPGSQSFSIAAPGCNFRCTFCQNWQISQMALDTGRINGQAVAPQNIVEAAVQSRCKSIAYTYTEPTVFMELCADCGRLARQYNLANVFVSNGFMTEQAIDFASEWLDGINIDIKAFTEDYYKKLCKARLKPVLDAVTHIAKNTRIWMELTTLIVPGQNDDKDEIKKLAEFIVSAAGPDVPWHVSRFFPNYQYTDSLPTPQETLQTALDIGKAAGLRYVYVGNLPGSKAENTLCHNCGADLIERRGYTILANRIKKSACPDCGTKIAGFQL